MNIELAYKKCCELIDEFESDYKNFMSKDYNEAKVRQYFINPFFEDVLGWDVQQKKGKKIANAEVTVEDSQRQKRTEGVKKVDYAFHTIKDKQKKLAFFVEAKQPSVQIKSESAYLQIKQYAQKAYLPISILTDFEQFHIIDCRAKISKANVMGGDNKEFYFTDFRERKKFDFVFNLLSRDAVYNGSIEQFLTTLKTVKGYQTAKDPAEIKGEEFLSYIEELRTYIAKALKYNDQDLDGEQLTELTQKIIDRLVFVRFLEDKGIEDTDWIKKWAESKNAFDTFVKDCDTLDRIYNGAVFKKHFLIDKKGFVANDDWFVEVCKEMIDPYSNYQFDFQYIPIHILGSVYERFLGSVIRVTAKDAKPEQKPEVRKAGGVYYTPKYIVDYIVENTIGKLIENKKPKEISKLKFADIACGSGSFLIGVYDYLIKYHNYYYNKNGKQAEADGCIKNNDENYRLSIRQKRDILLNNIFGVDIDAQAVEVTQLSLFLKMLEEETQESLRLKGNTLFTNERVLPDLKNNILCGNSLIGTDIIKNGELFENKEYQKLNPFDYETAFPAIMRNGGFDAIVGNPPYVMLQNLDSRESFDYTAKNYESAKYKIDAYQIFIEQALKKIKEKGLLSYITPNTFLKNIHSEPLRKFLIDRTSIKEIVLYSYGVFKDASVDTCVFTVEKGVSNQHLVNVKMASSTDNCLLVNCIPQSSFLKNDKYYFNVLVNNSDEAILNKIKEASVPLSNFCDAYFGIQTFDRKKYVSDFKKNETYKPVIDGANVNEYYLRNSTEFVEFVPNAIKSGGNPKIYQQDRVCIRQIGLTPIATYVNADIYTLNTIYNVYVKQGKKVDLQFILGIINSKLNKYYWKKNNSDQKGTFPKIKKDAILSIQIPQINFKNKPQKQSHDKIVSLVTQMLAMKKQTPKTEKEKQLLENTCKSLDFQIDSEVYKLYNLAPDEIEIVEAASK